MRKRYRSQSAVVRKAKRGKTSVYPRYSNPYSRISGKSVDGVPLGMRVTMKYAEHFSHSSGVTGYGENVFRAGSLFDPNLTGVGHQPLGHDEWSNIYQRYRVLGSKIEVKYANKSKLAAGTLQEPLTCALVLTGSSTLISGTDLASEYPVNTVAFIGRNNASKTLTLPYTTAWKNTGDPAAKNESDYSATFGSNPVRDSYYHVISQVVGSTNIDSKILVIITYDVWIFDPKQLTQS